MGASRQAVKPNATYYSISAITAFFSARVWGADRFIGEQPSPEAMAAKDATASFATGTVAFVTFTVVCSISRSAALRLLPATLFSGNFLPGTF